MAGAGITLAIVVLSLVALEVIRRSWLDHQLLQLRDDADQLSKLLQLAELPSSPALNGFSPNSLYVHRLPSAPQVDGYGDEWRAWGLLPEAESRTQEMPVVLGRFEQQAYLYKVLPASSSSLNLYAGTGVYRIEWQALGRITAFREPQGVREPSIQGRLQGSEEGLEVELQLPYELLQRQLSIGLQGRIEASSLIERWAGLDDWLEVMVSSNTRVSLINDRGWVLASAGSISARTDREGSGVFGLGWVFNRHLERWQDTLDQGRLMLSDKEQALGFNRAIGTWYQGRSQWVARVVSPLIFDDGQTITKLALVMESGAKGNGTSDQRGLSALLVLAVILVVLSLGLLLVLWAPWRYRLQALTTALASVLDRQGRVRPLLDDVHQDELGGLSRQIDRALQRLDDHSAYQRSLSSKLTHELRTPLAIIRTSLDNLALGEIQPEDRQFLDRAVSAAQRLSVTLNAMTAVSRIEESVSIAAKHYFSLSALVGQLQQAYEQLYPQVVISSVIPKQEAMLFGNPELIAQALDKMLENAVDYCPKGGCIQLGVRAWDDGWELWVHNEGPSLDGGEGRQLFGALVSHRNPSESEGAVHLGLGLYVVRLIADFHLGDVDARSDPNAGGARFSMLLKSPGAAV